MKIAQVVPIWERVPPPTYGGTQRVVYNLTEGLVKNGHDVTLFATGDSKTSAELNAIYPRALYRDDIPWTTYTYPMLNIISAFERAKHFDIIHCHIDRTTEYLGLVLASYIQIPVVFTLHFTITDPISKKDRIVFLNHYKRLNYVSISKRQQQAFKGLNFLAVVYNGIDLSKIPFIDNPGRSLVWLGRMSETKGPREAIMIAKQSKLPLILAGKLDTLNQQDMEYYTKEIKPHIDRRHVQFIGEVNDQQKVDLFRQALCLVNPIQWEEPFGLVPVEAMAAGVPVIANNRGAMPELIVNNKTGFLVENINQAAQAIKKINQIDRNLCRRHVQQNFSIETMVAGYQKVYQKIVRRP